MDWSFQDKCYNDSCSRKKFVTGQLVCQVALGDYWLGYQTPTRGGIIGEWHLDCFSEGYSKYFHEVTSVEQCCFCERRIKDREEVTYGVQGFKPGPPYVRPEVRGSKILFLICKKCMRTRDLGRISFW